MQSCENQRKLNLKRLSSYMHGELPTQLAPFNQQEENGFYNGSKFCYSKTGEGKKVINFY